MNRERRSRWGGEQGSECKELRQGCGRRGDPGRRFHTSCQESSQFCCLPLVKQKKNWRVTHYPKLTLSQSCNSMQPLLRPLSVPLTVMVTNGKLRERLYLCLM